MNIARILETVRRRLVTIDEGARLVEAASLLGRGRNDLVVVCDAGGVMVGVVTRTDIVSRISQCEGHACVAAVAAVMTGEVVSCRPDDTLQATWKRMLDRGLIHIPVIDAGNRPIGILNARDLLLALLREAESEEELMRDYVMGIGYR